MKYLQWDRGCNEFNEVNGFNEFIESYELNGNHEFNQDSIEI